MKTETLNFETLIGQINQVQDVLQAQAAHAVNLSLTARNWIVGYYIVEYEQHGEDRAKYGDNLLKKLAQRLNRRGFGERRLYEFRRIYLIYPQLVGVVMEYIVKNEQIDILRLTTAKSANTPAVSVKLRLPTAISNAPQEPWQTTANSLFYKLSATHLIVLSNIHEALKRAFYEQEAIRGCWTVTELDRQISSQYYERMGLSKNKMALR